MAVHKADSVIANPVHRRCVGGIHRSSAQAIEDEDHDIARHAADWLCLFRKESGRHWPSSRCGNQQDQNLFHRNSSKPKKVPQAQAQIATAIQWRCSLVLERKSHCPSKNRTAATTAPPLYAMVL